MGKVTISVCSFIFKVDHIESEVEQVHAGSRKKKLDRDVSCDSQRKTVWSQILVIQTVVDLQINRPSN